MAVAVGVSDTCHVTLFGLVLLFAHIKKLCVSCMRNFFYSILSGKLDHQINLLCDSVFVCLKYILVCLNQHFDAGKIYTH